MSFQLPTKRTSAAGEGIRWSGAAMLVEAMLLLAFLIASLAVLTQVFATAVEKANQGTQLTAAVAAASETAERFAANPAAVSEEQIVGDLLVVCKVTDEPRKAGVLHHADISVYAAPPGVDANAGARPQGEPVYTVSTSHYESGVGR